MRWKRRNESGRRESKVATADFGLEYQPNPQAVSPALSLDSFPASPLIQLRDCANGGCNDRSTIGIRAGVLLWLGFVLTTWATEYVYEVRPWSLLGINAGVWLFGMVIMGAIVGGWKKKVKVAELETASAAAGAP